MTTLSQRIGQAQRWLEANPRRADAAALLTLAALWALFFWRVLTPNPVNQVSYPVGDYTQQFLAFSSYQASRLLASEVPLWNPYNYAGHPFLADTQSAVFYPPRLLAIGASALLGGWGNNALHAETIAHFWLGTVLMYAFVRSVTRSPLAGLASALTVGYGGYLTGYPPLQLAVLEAGVWLPLALLGVYRASAGARWLLRWLAVSALAVGMSLLAGHPQTSLFLLYGLAAYTVHRAVMTGSRWLAPAASTALVAGLGFGLAAVQVLPGLEYMRLTVRSELGFDALAGGFPFGDMVGFLLPNVATLWSPLYSGIAVLVLGGIAVWRAERGARFWVLVVAVALAFSFGGASVLYNLAYLLGPGFSWFRGQERSAYLIAYGVAVLAGLGVASLRRRPLHSLPLSRGLGVAAGAAWALALLAFVQSRFIPPPEAFALVNALFLLALLALAAWLLFGRAGGAANHPLWAVALLALIVFDLFTASMRTNWQPVPAGDQPLYDDALVDALPAGDLHRIDGAFQIDSERGLAGNFATLLEVQDIRGASPLRLKALDRYLTGLPGGRLHELLNVAYVLTDYADLDVRSRVVGQNDSAPPTLVHELDDPFPRAWLATRVITVEDDEAALTRLADPDFDPRTTVLLHREVALGLPDDVGEDGSVEVTAYAPEDIEIAVSSPHSAVLVVSEWDYPGWQATVNGQPAPILRANAGLRAIVLPAGEHVVTMRYRPASVRIGAGISALSLLLTLGGLGMRRALFPASQEDAP